MAGPRLGAPPATPVATGRILATLVLAVVAFQLASSMVTPALPDIATSLSAPVAEVARSQDLFFLVNGVAGVVLARLSDHLGRRRVLLGTLALLCAGAVLAAVTPGVPLLIAGRILQGAAGATFPLTYVLLRETMPPARFGTALGLITAINGGVGGVDGLVGGLLSDHLGFRWIFVAIVVVAVAAMVSTARVLPEAPARTTGRMDWRGAAFLSAALVCVNLALSQGSAHGWSDVRPLALLAGGLLLLLCFRQAEKRRAHPLIAVEHLRTRQVWPLITTTVLTLTGVFAALNFTIVLLSQDRHTGYGMSATLSSLLFLTPPAAIGLLAAPLTGRLASRRGWLLPLRAGLLLCAAVLAVAACFPQNRWVMLAAVCGMGVCYNGLALTTLNGLGVIQSPKESPGALPGLNGSCFGIGASVGIALAGPLVGSGTLTGYRNALWLAVGISLLALVASLLIAANEPRATGGRPEAPADKAPAADESRAAPDGSRVAADESRAEGEPGRA
ncbi:MFS transporter [Streptomyces sp. NPDC003077]|uniref:MFS transporter n=1 Tax=Streptomyces sp. NPDC003077 TaxID=3154443 RepID=UPI0033B1778F